MTGPTLLSPVVSTQWLADYLGSEHLVVLDATVLPFASPTGKPGYLSGHEQYLLTGHIPTALFADLVEEFSDPEATFPFTHGTARAFAQAAGALGIDNMTTVVIYDSSIGHWAARLWWLFRSFGHDRVAVLDGGYQKWQAEERQSDIGYREPVATTFVPNERPDVWVTKTDIENILETEPATELVCALAPKEFSGEEGRRARLGHIPGSINVPAARLVSRESNALLPEPELREAFAEALLRDRVVLYCAAGILATLDALVLTLLGHRNISVYDGSLSEWAADERLPMVTLAP